MTSARIEHVNYTVSDSCKTADTLVRLFDWKIRWEGPSLGGGHTVHVGTDDMYVALYTPAKTVKEATSSYDHQQGLNHIGIQVDDLDAAEHRVSELGFTPFNHSDYEPGKRFYFHDNDGTEYEIVSYA